MRLSSFEMYSIVYGLPFILILHDLPWRNNHSQAELIDALWDVLHDF